MVSEMNSYVSIVYEECIRKNIIDRLEEGITVAEGAKALSVSFGISVEKAEADILARMMEGSE